MTVTGTRGNEYDKAHRALEHAGFALGSVLDTYEGEMSLPPRVSHALNDWREAWATVQATYDAPLTEAQ